MSILSKKLIDTFSFSTINTDRRGEMLVRIYGRNFIKLGIYQAVTLVGDLYEVYDPDVKHDRRLLLVGVSKQHPRDIKADKEVAYELAHERAFTDPQIIMEVGPNFCSHDFRHLAHTYVDSLELKFVKTREEIDVDNFTKMMDQTFTDEYFDSPEYYMDVCDDYECDKCCCEEKYPE